MTIDFPIEVLYNRYSHLLFPYSTPMDKTNITGQYIDDLLLTQMTSQRCTEDGCGQLLTDLEVKLYVNVCGHCYSHWCNAGEDFNNHEYARDN